MSLLSGDLIGAPLVLTINQALSTLRFSLSMLGAIFDVIEKRLNKNTFLFSGSLLYDVTALQISCFVYIEYRSLQV